MYIAHSDLHVQWLLDVEHYYNDHTRCKLFHHCSVKIWVSLHLRSSVIGGFSNVLRVKFVFIWAHLYFLDVFREHITASKSEAICNEEEESDIRTEFQICSHNTTTQLYEDIQTINSPKIVMDIVCQALKDLSDECIGYLLECFLEDDLLDIKRLYLQDWLIDLFLRYQ